MVDENGQISLPALYQKIGKKSGDDEVILMNRDVPRIRTLDLTSSPRECRLKSPDVSLLSDCSECCQQLDFI